MEFLRKLNAAVSKNNSLLCVGLDPNMDKLPAHLADDPTPFFAFNKAIIDATADLVCAFKPNSAFYEALGVNGIAELKKTCDYIRTQYPDIPLILDYKRGDIGTTNKHYGDFAFDYLKVDAVTIHPYFGQEAIQPFLDRKDKGVIIMCRNSNPGAGEFQNLEVDGQKLYMRVARNVTKDWNGNGNCLLVVGATAPSELADVRQIVGDMVLLVPGIGAQGGDLEATLEAGLTAAGRGLIINSSRDIIYQSPGKDFAEAARIRATATRNLINKYRREN